MLKIRFGVYAKNNNIEQHGLDDFALLINNVTFIMFNL